MIKYLSLFSGIGGFEYGIQLSRHRDKLINIGYSEIDKYADSIYRKRFPSRMVGDIHTHTPMGDVTKLRTSDLPSFDLLVGGFPCQAFSIAGKRRGFDDTRGTLFFEIARILRDKRPRYFLLENVKGLLSHDKGKTLQEILRVLTELGYDIQYQVYNCKNHDVPQNRERIYLKGYFRERCGGEILSLRNTNKEVAGAMNFYTPPNRCGKLVDVGGINGTLTTSGKDGEHNTFINENQLMEITSKVSQGRRVYDSKGLGITLNARGNNGYYVDYDSKMNCIGNIRPSNHIEDNVYGSDGLVSTICRSNVPIIEDNVTLARPVLTPDRVNKRQNGRRMKEDGEPSFTITSTDRYGVYDEFRIRRLTPIECERLQGFPDDWTKYGADGEIISNTQRYKCLGNAVTTTVVRDIFNNWDLRT